MKWLMRLLGIRSREERLKQQMLKAEQQSFEAQRKGDMEEAGVWKAKAEAIAAELASLTGS
jgi:predicted NBD/HSP70 family sugar kinase